MFDPIVHQDSSLGPCPCSCNPSTGLAVSEEGKCAYSGLVSEGEVEYDALEVSGKEEEKESTYFSAASVEEICTPIIYRHRVLLRCHLVKGCPRPRFVS